VHLGLEHGQRDLVAGSGNVVGGLELCSKVLGNALDTEGGTQSPLNVLLCCRFSIRILEEVLPPLPPHPVFEVVGGWWEGAAAALLLKVQLRMSSFTRCRQTKSNTVEVKVGTAAAAAYYVKRIGRREDRRREPDSGSTIATLTRCCGALSGECCATFWASSTVGTISSSAAVTSGTSAA